MERDEAKAKILKGVSQKLKRRGVIIAACSAVLVLGAGVAAGWWLFMRQTPIPADDFVATLPTVEELAAGGEELVDGYEACVYKGGVEREVENVPCRAEGGWVIGAGSGETLGQGEFKGVRAYTKRQTINQLDNRELAYNQVVLPVRLELVATLYDNLHTHVENRADGTAVLYFYMSESLSSKGGSHPEGKANMDILFGYHLCDTCDEGAVLNPITRIYYLVHDYDNFKQAEFDKVKNKAVLLWQK